MQNERLINSVMKSLEASLTSENNTSMGDFTLSPARYELLLRSCLRVLYSDDLCFVLCIIIVSNVFSKRVLDFVIFLVTY